GEVMHDVRHPLPAFVKLFSDVLHLLDVIVQLFRPSGVHARQGFDPDSRRPDCAAVAIEAPSSGLQRAEPLRQHREVVRPGGPVDTEAQIIKADVETLCDIVQRSEQKLQKDAGSLIGTVFEPGDALGELGANIVELLGAAAPYGDDALLPSD